MLRYLFKIEYVNQPKGRPRTRHYTTVQEGGDLGLRMAWAATFRQCAADAQEPWGQGSQASTCRIEYIGTEVSR